MRALAIDFGERRIGIAVSDASGTLARPWRTIAGHRDLDTAVAAVLDALRLFEAEHERIETIVVGLPKRLDGSANAQTPRASDFAERLARRTDRTVVLQDERLTSHEADQRLAAREPRWRARKARLDAAAAAVILQEHLDARADARRRRAADAPAPADRSDAPSSHDDGDGS